MRPHIATRLSSILLFALIASGGCSDGMTTPGGPGQLTVTLSSTDGAGSAFLVSVTGEDVSDPVAAAGGQRVYSFLSGNTTKVAVVGTTSSGPLFKFSVPDVGQAQSYSVSVEQVAGSDNELLPVSGFTLQVIR